MKFRGPQALYNRRQKTIVCPTTPTCGFGAVLPIAGEWGESRHSTAGVQWRSLASSGITS